MRAMRRVSCSAVTLLVLCVNGPVHAFARYGQAVLVGDGEIFVGEPANSSRPGRVYVYRKGSAWFEAAVLQAPAAAVNDSFGDRLALDGERLVVGAGGAALHVFSKVDGAWRHDAAIPAADVPGNGIQFGRGLAMAGEWVFISSASRLTVFDELADKPPSPPPGAVYAFKRGSSGAFAYQATLTAQGTGTEGDEFGAGIAAQQDQLLIGAPRHAKRGGIVYEFRLGADGVWQQQRSFAPIGLQPADGFGARVVLRGPNAFVAAPDQGRFYAAVYVYRRVAEGADGASTTQPTENFTWTEIARLTPPVGVRFDGFGTQLAASDREVWVGAWRAGQSGRVYVFPYSEEELQLDGLRVLGPESTEDLSAGYSVSLRGNVAAVGAPNAGNGSGGLLVYERDAFGVWRAAQPLLTPEVDELPALTGTERRCQSSGRVEIFDCGATDLLSFLPPSRLSHDGRSSEMSSIWGWTDPQTKQEWAIIGRSNGATFVDITTPSRPVTVADLPMTEGARPSSWREIKVYEDHAFIVSDGSGAHGVQIFDLTRLRGMKPRAGGLPQQVHADAVYRNVASVHNIVVNEDSGFAYAVGANGGGTTCGGGLHMIDIRDPKHPVFAGCYADAGSGVAKTGYSHDAQCVTYKGPDKRYTGREICIGSNETAISVADVTDKKNPKFISRASYPTVAYIHQGWFDETQRYFYVNDEGDEMTGSAKKTRTLIWDLGDLETPVLAKEHLGVEASTDHNLYIKGQLMYQANYTSGLRVLSIKDPVNPREIAYFDTAPYHANTPGFNGAWSVYPFFRSGTIVVSSIEQGLFVLRTADR